MFFMALVNYSDEYLTHSNTAKTVTNPHEKIGGVFLMSTFTCLIGITALFFFIPDFNLNNLALMLTLFSSLFMVCAWAGYFYLFQMFSAHQVVPLFGLSSIWLLLMELSFGASISITGLLGVGVLIIGAYLLDNGSLKIKAPSKLLLYMLPVSLSWALTMFLIRQASLSSDALVIYFWQLAGILAIGLTFFLVVTPYRRGFIKRVTTEKKKFIVPSLFNESFSQLAFMFSTLAVATAPLAVYVTASGGIQSIFLLLLFSLFPLNDRNHILSTQWAGIVFIGLGIALIELWK